MSPLQNASNTRMNKQPEKRINRQVFHLTFHRPISCFPFDHILMRNGKQSLYITFYYNCLVFKEM